MLIADLWRNGQTILELRPPKNVQSIVASHTYLKRKDTKLCSQEIKRRYQVESLKFSKHENKILITLKMTAVPLFGP